MSTIVSNHFVPTRSDSSTAPHIPPQRARTWPTRAAGGRSARLAALAGGAVIALLLIEPGAGATPPKKGPKKGPAAGGSDPAPTDAIDQVKRSTALIERKDGGSGSGFVIQPGIVMTNFHVISGAAVDELTVRFVSLDDTAPPALKPALLYCHPGRDLAVLKVDTDRPPLEFCPADMKLEGIEVAVVGNPTDGVRGQVTVNKVTTGHLAAPIRRGAGWTYYELRAEARPGNSGGPVVDRRTGKLVGVMQSIAVGKGPERSYCIPFGEVKLALDRLPATKEKEPEAVKVAAARHCLDYFNREMPVIENMARNAMTLQVNLLKAKALGGGARVEVYDRRTGQTLSGAEVLTQLKEEYARSYARLEKFVDGPVRASPEVPSGLASKARHRLETCGAMRSLAGGKTETEAAFRHQIDARTAANDKAARAFEDDYKKFLDGLDAPPKGK
jgi:S1-C subfamily serine protease